MSKEGTNCRNCGAPLDRHGDCEYCGTKSPRRFSSGIEITAESIRLYADDLLVDEDEAVKLRCGSRLTSRIITDGEA